MIVPPRLTPVLVSPIRIAPQTASIIAVKINVVGDRAIIGAAAHRQVRPGGDDDLAGAEGIGVANLQFALGNVGIAGVRVVGCGKKASSDVTQDESAASRSW